MKSYSVALLLVVLLVTIVGTSKPAHASVTHPWTITAPTRPTDSQINSFISSALADGRRFIYGATRGNNAEFVVLASNRALNRVYRQDWMSHTLWTVDGSLASVWVRTATEQVSMGVSNGQVLGAGVESDMWALLPLTTATVAFPLPNHTFPYPGMAMLTVIHFTGTRGGVSPEPIRLRVHDLTAGIALTVDITEFQGAAWVRTYNLLGVGAYRAEIIDSTGNVLVSVPFTVSAVPPPPPPTQPVPPPPPVDPVAPPTLGVDPTIWDRIFWAVDYVIWLIGRPFRLLAELLAVVVDNVQGLVGAQFGVLGAVMGAFYSALPPEASVLLSTLLMVFTVVTIYRLVRP